MKTRRPFSGKIHLREGGTGRKKCQNEKGHSSHAWCPFWAASIPLISQYHEDPLALEVRMNRRVFVLEAGKAVPAIIGALYLVGCGDSPSSPSATADISATSSTSNAHTHSVGIPASDQMKAVAVTYTSSSTLAHDHQVSVSASQLATLASGGS